MRFVKGSVVSDQTEAESIRLIIGPRLTRVPRQRTVSWITRLAVIISLVPSMWVSILQVILLYRFFSLLAGGVGFHAALERLNDPDRASLALVIIASLIGIPFGAASFGIYPYRMIVGALQYRDMRWLSFFALPAGAFSTLTVLSASAAGLEAMFTDDYIVTFMVGVIATLPYSISSAIGFINVREAFYNGRATLNTDTLSFVSKDLNQTHRMLKKAMAFLGYDRLKQFENEELSEHVLRDIVWAAVRLKYEEQKKNSFLRCLMRYGAHGCILFILGFSNLFNFNAGAQVIPRAAAAFDIWQPVNGTFSLNETLPSALCIVADIAGVLNVALNMALPILFYMAEFMLCHAPLDLHYLPMIPGFFFGFAQAILAQMYSADPVEMAASFATIFLTVFYAYMALCRKSPVIDKVNTFFKVKYYQNNASAESAGLALITTQADEEKNITNRNSLHG